MIQKRIYNYFERNPQLHVLFIFDLAQKQDLLVLNKALHTDITLQIGMSSRVVENQIRKLRNYSIER